MIHCHIWASVSDLLWDSTDRRILFHLGRWTGDWRRNLTPRLTSEYWKCLHPSRPLVGGFPGGSVVKNPPAKAGEMGSIPGSGRSLEEEMATHPSILAWEIPWTEEPRGLQSTGSQRVGHDWGDWVCLCSFHYSMDSPLYSPRPHHTPPLEKSLQSQINWWEWANSDVFKLQTFGLINSRHSSGLHRHM